MTEQFTLTLDKNAADRIRDIVRPFGGTVTKYAQNLAEAVSILPLPDQGELWTLIDAKLKRLGAQATPPPEVTAAPSLPPTPAVPLPQSVRRYRRSSSGA